MLHVITHLLLESGEFDGESIDGFVQISVFVVVVSLPLIEDVKRPGHETPHLVEGNGPQRHVTGQRLGLTKSLTPQM